MKIHYLLPGKFGLFEHSMTGCGAAGHVEVFFMTVHLDTVVHYRTGAKYPSSEDKRDVTCRVCKEFIVNNHDHKQDEDKAEIDELSSDPTEMLFQAMNLLHVSTVPPSLQEDADILLKAFKKYVED